MPQGGGGFVARPRDRLDLITVRGRVRHPPNQEGPMGGGCRPSCRRGRASGRVRTQQGLENAVMMDEGPSSLSSSGLVTDRQIDREHWFSVSHRPDHGLAVSRTTESSQPAASPLPLLRTLAASEHALPSCSPGNVTPRNTMRPVVNEAETSLLHETCDGFEAHLHPSPRRN